MINFDLNLKDVDNLLKNPATIVGLILVLIVLSIFFGMTLSSSDVKVVCGDYIKTGIEQRALITDLETKHAECIAKGETSCIEREQRICRNEKEQLKNNCNRLMEEVLNGRGGD